MPKKQSGPSKVFRLSVLGMPEVGKTCLCMQYTNTSFTDNYTHTEQVKGVMPL